MIWKRLMHVYSLLRSNDVRQYYLSIANGACIHVSLLTLTWGINVYLKWLRLVLWTKYFNLQYSVFILVFDTIVNASKHVPFAKWLYFEIAYCFFDCLISHSIEVVLHSFIVISLHQVSDWYVILCAVADCWSINWLILLNVPLIILVMQFWQWLILNYALFLSSLFENVISMFVFR